MEYGNDAAIMADDSPGKPPETTLSEFFESKPAYMAFTITEVTLQPIAGPLPGRIAFKPPVIRLWCDSDECDGLRTMFDPVNDYEVIEEKEPKAQDRYIEFVCRNCTRSRKRYVYFVEYNAGKKELIAVKFGEYPPLSMHLPSRLRKLVGTDQEKFNKGLKSEAQGLGVGAFAYYRQVLENQKDRLIDEIIKVVNLRSPVPQELLEELEQAKRETRFTSAVEKIKHGLPEVLLINSQNPLTLLHKALSEGLHNGNDEECLEIAQDIRVVLSEFSEQLQTALKDDQELKKAVSRIQNRSKKHSDK